MRESGERPIYIDEAAEYEVRGGTMLVKWDGLELAIPIAVFQECRRRCSRALDAWHEERGVILPFR